MSSTDSLMRGSRPTGVGSAYRFTIWPFARDRPSNWHVPSRSRLAGGTRCKGARQAAANSIEETRLRVEVRRRLPSEEVECLDGGDTPSRRTNDELFAEQIRFALVAQGVGGGVHRGGDRLDPRRAAGEHVDQDFEVAAVLLVEP